MDKEENVQQEVSPMDLPVVNDENKEQTISQVPSDIEMPAMNETSTSPETTNEPTIELPAENRANNDFENMTLPSLNIANSESVDDNETKIASNSILDNQADFQSIFNVTSEETPASKDAAKKSIDKSLATVIENKKVEESALPEDSKTPDAEKEKSMNRQKNFNGAESVIYEIQEEKEGNPIVVVLFFMALISVILALPYISKRVTFNNGTPVNNDKKDEQSSEDQFYIFGRSSVRAKIGNLEFTNFVKHKNIDETYSLTFNLSNKQQKAYTFSEKYYVVFYKEDTIVYRALIYAKEAIGANAITSVELPITERSYNEADRFKIVEILPASYTKISLTEAEGEFRILTCVSSRDEMRYYFIDNKLVKVKETFKDNIQNLERGKDENLDTFEARKRREKERFDESIQDYYKLSETYKKIDKFSSIFISSADEFTMINEFNFQDIPDTVINNLNEYKFFRYNENKDIINFEMEAMSYFCG